MAILTTATISTYIRTVVVVAELAIAKKKKITGPNDRRLGFNFVFFQLFLGAVEL